MSDLSGESNFRSSEIGNEADFGKSAWFSKVAETYASRLRLVVERTSVAEFARRSTVAHSTIAAILEKQSLPRWETAVKIAHAAGRSLDWFAGDDQVPDELLRFAESLDATGHHAAELRASYGAGRVPGLDRQFVLVPLYDVRAAAGHGAWNDAERISKKLAFRRDWIAANLQAAVDDLVLIYIDGDSMEPRFADGDVVMVDRGAREVRADGIYVFTLDGGLLIKHLQRLPGGRLRAVSDNPVYQPFELTVDQLGDEGIVGRVVWGGIRL